MTIVEEYRRNSGRVLDRLVDGELGPQQRRELLANFDDEPGAWRSCALAFLEEQSWRLQMARVASEPILEQMKATPRAGGGASGLAWGSWLAVAASLLVAFAIGTRYSIGLSAPGSQNPQITQREHVPIVTSEHPQNEAMPAAEAPFTLTLTPLGGDNREAIELPVIESGAAGEFAAAANRSALSRALVQRFEQDGFEVNRQQQMWPVDLPDGRRVLVPIEEVDIRSPSVERL
jgi:hypothetical protein